MATKYSVSVFDGRSWEDVALFADTVLFDAMVDFCLTQFACGNSLTTPGENIAIVDMDTGEVLWDYCHMRPLDDDDHWGGCEPADIDDDCGYDPYMGCYSDNC